MKKLISLLLLLMFLLSGCVTSANPPHTTTSSTGPTLSAASEAETLPSEMGSARQEGTQLNKEELMAFEFLLQDGVYPYTQKPESFYNAALLSTYSTAEDVDLRWLFYNTFEEVTQELTEPESDFIQRTATYIPDVPVTRISAAKIDEVLLQHFGLTLEQTNKVGFTEENGIYYFPETDCYYHQHSDFNNTSQIEVTDGYMQSEESLAGSYPPKIITLYYNINLWGNECSMILTLATAHVGESGYRIISNIPVDRDAPPSA